MRILKDIFYREINNVCHIEGFEFEAKNLALLQLLLKSEMYSMNELAIELKQSHVSITQKIDELKKKYMVIILIDDKDHRRKKVKLTQYGRNIANEANKTWIRLDKVMNELLNENAPGFIDMIDKLEKSLQNKSIAKRIKECELKEELN